MRYLALAADYDGTPAADGVVSPAAVAALERVVASGRKLILVTDRQLEDLPRVFPHLDLFHRVVAETARCSIARLPVNRSGWAKPRPRRLSARCAHEESSRSPSDARL
jgi:hypothetical protein